LKILILKPSSLGDVIHALPVLRHLRRAFPSAQIHWWIEKSISGILEGDPDLDGVHLFNRKNWASKKGILELWKNMQDIRSEHFDWVIDLQGLARSGIVAWLANGGLTIGVEDTREHAYSLYDISVPRPTPQTHAVDWYLEVLKPLGVNTTGVFEWLPPKVTTQQYLSRTHSFFEKPYLALVPGARWTNKRWPSSHFRELIGAEAEKNKDLNFVILGGFDDRTLASQISVGLDGRVIDLTGRTTLLQLVEIIRKARGIVTNDTGPMHIAAAVNTPMTALFGPTNPNRTGPYLHLDSVLQLPVYCSPCMKSDCSNPDYMACLKGLTSKNVSHRLSALSMV
jgi:heptosyltransferase-1